MTGTRFIALVGPEGAAPDLAARFADRARLMPDFGLTFESDRVCIVSGSRTPVSLGEHGVVLGSLFAGDATRPITALTRDERERIVASRGARLVESYWGPYLAVIADRRTGRTDIVRAPLGELPCYIVRHSGATMWPRTSTCSPRSASSYHASRGTPSLPS